MPKSKITKECWECLKCSYKWIPKKGFNPSKKPMVCPRCNNPRWEEPRKETKKNEILPHPKG